MKNKAPLSLMEQLVMLTVFALAAGLCLQIFVLSSLMSRRGEAADHAVTKVQNAAEVLKASDGDFSKCGRLLGGAAAGEGWQICYDDRWEETSRENAAYELLICPVSEEIPLLGSARISASTVSGDPLFAITVSWQEVSGEETTS